MLGFVEEVFIDLAHRSVKIPHRVSGHRVLQPACQPGPNLSKKGGS